MTSRPSRGSLILLGLSLLWLAGMLWSANANIVGTGNALGALIQVADALPVVIAASMVAGAATAHAALRWWRPQRTALRWPAGAACGTAVGAVAAGLILIGYGHRSSIVVLAVSVLLAGTVGGALGALQPVLLVAGGLAGTLVAFVVAFALAVFQDQLLGLLGAGTSPASQLAAASRLALTTSLLGGVGAGVVGFAVLRRGSERRFLVYLAAGAFPGVVWLLSEAITLTGGAQVYGLVGGLSEADRAILDYTGQSRLNHGLILLFVGAIVALVCFGRTLRPAEKATEKATEKAAATEVS